VDLYQVRTSHRTHRAGAVLHLDLDLNQDLKLSMGLNLDVDLDPNPNVGPLFCSFFFFFFFCRSTSPFLRSDAALMEALAQAKDEGLAAAVGVSNYSRQEVSTVTVLMVQCVSCSTVGRYS